MDAITPATRFRRFVGERLQKTKGLTESEAQAITDHGGGGTSASDTQLLAFLRERVGPDAAHRLEREFQQFKTTQSALGIDLTPGMRFGRWVIESEVGRGGGGLVYKAMWAGKDRPVAIKFLQAGAGATQTQYERFVKEARVTKRLRHANIVEVYEAGVYKQTVPFYVMEWVDGPSLEELIQEYPMSRMRPKEALKIIHDVLLALEHSHRQGVVHRDVKPANILVASGGEAKAHEVGPVSLRVGDRYLEGFHAKIADFGVARELASPRQLTLTGESVGTPYYMSPEQARGAHDVDARTDIYSVGATLYHALTGKPPFDAETEGELYHKIANVTATSPRQVNAAIPEQLEAIINKAMSKDPALRYQSAKEFAGDVERFLRHQNVRAYSGRMMFKLRTEWSRRPGRLMALASAAALAIVAGIIALVLGSRAPAPANVRLALSCEDLCIPASLPLKAEWRGGDPPLTFEWSVRGGKPDWDHKSTNEPTATVLLSEPGDTHVSVTITDCHGRSAPSSEVTVRLLARLEVQLPKRFGPIMVGKRQSLEATPKGGNGHPTYRWIVEGPVSETPTAQSSLEGEHPTFHADRPGDYRIHLTLKDPPGAPCEADSELHVYDLPIRSVVTVKTLNGWGSGFLIDVNEHKYVVTNNHVIDDWGPIYIFPYSENRTGWVEGERIRARVVVCERTEDHSEGRDLAILRLEGDDLPRDPLSLASEQPHSNECVEILGSGAAPGAEFRGIGTKTGHIGNWRTSDRTIHLDAPVNGGDSGEPVVRYPEGRPPEVIGVTVTKQKGAQCQADAIPASTLQDLVQCVRNAPRTDPLHSDRDVATFLTEISTLIARLAADLKSAAAVKQGEADPAGGEAAFSKLQEDGLLSWFTILEDLDNKLSRRRLDDQEGQRLLQVHGVIRDMGELFVTASNLPDDERRKFLDQPLNERREFLRDQLSGDRDFITAAASAQSGAVCTFCGGKKTVQCPACQGDGKCPRGPCANCEMTGRCAACKGHGNLPCPLCDGQGKFP